MIYLTEEKKAEPAAESVLDTEEFNASAPEAVAETAPENDDDTL